MSNRRVGLRFLGIVFSFLGVTLNKTPITCPTQILIIVIIKLNRITVRFYKDVNTHWDLTVALKVKALKKLRAFAFYLQISRSFFYFRLSF